MLPIRGRPFLEYELELLRLSGFQDILLCIGYLSDQIISHFGDGSRFGVRLDYSCERGELLGTAGALQQALPLLDAEFMLTYGDTYLPMDYEAPIEEFRIGQRLALMVVQRNHDRFERSNVVIGDGLVQVYDKVKRTPEMVHMNYGVALLRRQALALVPAGVPYSQEAFFHDLILRRQLIAFETDAPFQEIGSRAGIARFRRYLQRRGMGTLPAAVSA
jgi:NDP-sugar pyrophosphorylase family protein